MRSDANAEVAFALLTNERALFSKFDDANAAVSRDHDVVKEFDADELSDRFDVFSDLQIFRARLRVSRWMVMYEHDARGRIENGGPKFLSGVNQREIEDAHGDLVASNHPVV